MSVSYKAGENEYWSMFIKPETAARRPILKECATAPNSTENKRQLRSDSIVYTVPDNMYWNVTFQQNNTTVDQNDNIQQKDDVKYGKYSPQEDKAVTHAMKNHLVDISSLATQLNRSSKSVKQRMCTLRKRRIDKGQVEASTSESSMEILQKFLAVEEESSVDLDAAIDALDQESMEIACHAGAVCGLSCYDDSAVPRGDVAGSFDLRSLETLSDLSSTAMNVLSAAGDLVQAELSTCAQLEDNRTLSGSDESTVHAAPDS